MRDRSTITSIPVAAATPPATCTPRSVAAAQPLPPVSPPGFWRLVLVIFLTLPAPVSAREKTDVITLRNGDRITGEIRELARGRLTLKTDYADELTIEWDKVEHVDSHQRFEIELDDGSRYSGTFQPSESRHALTIVDGSTRVTVERVSIVRITPGDLRFWNRMRGSVDMGFGFTKAQSSKTLSLGARATYWGRLVQTAVTATSLFKNQTNAGQVSVHSLSHRTNIVLGSRWFISEFERLERNDELGLQLRALLGGGYGRHLVQSNIASLAIVGGALYSRELFATDPEATNNAEALAGVQFSFFAFGQRETTIDADALLFPSISNAGRVRLESNADVRRKLAHGFSIKLSMYETYDSRPPSAELANNDWSVESALGWSF